MAQGVLIGSTSRLHLQCTPHLHLLLTLCQHQQFTPVLAPVVEYIAPAPAVPFMEYIAPAPAVPVRQNPLRGAMPSGMRHRPAVAEKCDT